MLIRCYLAKCLGSSRLDTGHWLGFGIQHDDLVVGLDCRRDNTYDAVL